MLLPLLLNLGFAGSEGEAVLGPYRAAAVEVFVAGQREAEVFVAGSRAAEVFVAGSRQQEVFPA